MPSKVTLKLWIYAACKLYPRNVVPNIKQATEILLNKIDMMFLTIFNSYEINILKHSWNRRAQE